MVGAVRYGIPIAFALAGFAALIFADDAGKLEGFVLFTGAGLSVLLLNVLHRIGVEGDTERTREEKARDYFDRHGRWPGEE